MHISYVIAGTLAAIYFIGITRAGKAYAAKNIEE